MYSIDVKILRLIDSAYLDVEGVEWVKWGRRASFFGPRRFQVGEAARATASGSSISSTCRRLLFRERHICF